MFRVEKVEKKENILKAFVGIFSAARRCVLFVKCDTQVGVYCIRHVLKLVPGNDSHVWKATKTFKKRVLLLQQGSQWNLGRGLLA